MDFLKITDFFYLDEYCNNYHFQLFLNMEGGNIF